MSRMSTEIFYVDLFQHLVQNRLIDVEPTRIKRLKNLK